MLKVMQNCSGIMFNEFVQKFFLFDSCVLFIESKRYDMHESWCKCLCKKEWFMSMRLISLKNMTWVWIMTLMPMQNECRPKVILLNHSKCFFFFYAKICMFVNVYAWKCMKYIQFMHALDNNFFWFLDMQEECKDNDL